MDAAAINSQTNIAQTNISLPSSTQSVTARDQLASGIRDKQKQADAANAKDQVTLSDASRRYESGNSSRVSAQDEVKEFKNESQPNNNNQIQSPQNSNPLPNSVVRALDSYSQTSVL